MAELQRCSKEGCGTVLRFPEEHRRGECAVCTARGEGYPKQDPRRYALIPGLLEALDIIEEIRTVHGIPGRARGRAEHLKEMLTQLIQNQRVAHCDAAALENQLQLLLGAQMELARSSPGHSGRVRLPTGWIQMERAPHPRLGRWVFQGEVMQRLEGG